MLCIKPIQNKKLMKFKPLKPKSKYVLIKLIPKAQTNQTHPQNLIPPDPSHPIPKGPNVQTKTKPIPKA